MSEVDNEESEGGGKGGILKIILIVIGILVFALVTEICRLFIGGFLTRSLPRKIQRSLSRR